ncbi:MULTISPECIES: chorismate mutase [Cytobacillus]|uniref:chorismate mutase n=3 Tax=Cytobacillus TaxID=2675230 RepID=A0A160MDT2_9BACI|nr:MULTISPECIES: chorismate mutase [Cytobacillus]EFV77583.1 chorismate mutase [Bacillus sp. 2_A_57_CT2]MBY0154710.1 chorismate mutase [Cytobacillus firmus]AND41236.1 chorismate mutase [Cytobacillus oceanisediminis 2691]MBU8733577.1 chorismate mutase [Cytobacillus oceanisediminis]MCM3243594.1 chorismate mutase [Cytobacillus oceanisediminis]
MIRGVRGAVTVDKNSESEILEATEMLIRQMIQENKINSEDVASVFISVTEELTAAFPAKAMRSIEGWTYVPVMCMREIPVEGSLRNCIRVMMHVNIDVPQENICHIYLREAIQLRPDLKTTDSP